MSRQFQCRPDHNRQRLIVAVQSARVESSVARVWECQETHFPISSAKQAHFQFCREKNLFFCFVFVFFCPHRDEQTRTNTLHKVLLKKTMENGHFLNHKHKLSTRSPFYTVVLIKKPRSPHSILFRTPHLVRSIGNSWALHTNDCSPTVCVSSFVPTQDTLDNQLLCRPHWHTTVARRQGRAEEQPVT